MNLTTHRTRTLALIGAGLGTTALALGGAALASDGGPQGARAVGVHAKSGSVVACDGGAHKSLRTRIVNSPFTFGETAINQEDQDIPGASVVVGGPARGTDTYLITFSAETQVRGGDDDDWMGLEIHVDGTPIDPYTASGDVLAFTGEPSWNSNSMQFCVKLGKGPHQVQAKTNLSDFLDDSNLAGWLDDYTLSVQRYQ